MRFGHFWQKNSTFWKKYFLVVKMVDFLAIFTPCESCICTVFSKYFGTYSWYPILRRYFHFPNVWGAWLQFRFFSQKDLNWSSVSWNLHVDVCEVNHRHLTIHHFPPHWSRTFVKVALAEFQNSWLIQCTPFFVGEQLSFSNLLFFVH